MLVSTFSFNFDVLLPLVARLTLDAGARTFGLIAAVFGAGALTGALILATDRQGARAARRSAARSASASSSSSSRRQDSLPAVCVLLYLIGIFYILWGSSSLATLQLAAPEHLRGRAASLYFFGFMGGAPLGGLIAGWLSPSSEGRSSRSTVAGTVAVLTAAWVQRRCAGHGARRRGSSR